MKVLLINAGSSSLKYQLIDMKNEQVIAKGNCERVGIKDPFITYKHDGKEMKFDGAKNHEEAVAKVLEILTNPEYGVVKTLDEIDAVGHRVLQGGWIYKESVLVDNKVLKNLEKLIPIGPLHMPANIAGIRACQKVMPNIPHVAIFDTAFHATMPEKAYLYAIKYEDSEKYHIRKYGFHGSSHRFITFEAAKILKKPVNEVNLIIAHMGNGSSVTAVQNGKSIDTTMGLTPLQGLVMGTRSGDVDATVVQYLCNNKKMTVDEAINYLNKQSGVLGVSGVDSDMRSVEAGAAKGNKRCQLALDMVAYAARKHIGSYLAVLNKVDAIIFTGGVGENGAQTREDVIGNMENLGIVLDKEKNKNFKRGEVNLISARNSKVKIYVIPTNEELMMARDTKAIADALPKKKCAKKTK
ncbi:MAG: acetate kinase [Clostridia bacterium]|nr:acetate kinase [Clostridia bacterium]